MDAIQVGLLYVSLFISLFFEIFLLITYLEVRSEIKFENEHIGKDVKRFPSVSIIVPSWNEEDTVEGTVNSLLALDYPKDKLTLLLIDDGSTDGTLEVLHKFDGNPQVRVFTKKNEGSKYSALNFGLTHVDTDLVGCLDADSFVDAQALMKIVPYFADETIMAVTPAIRVFEPKTVIQHIQKIEYTWGVFLRRMLSSIGGLYVTPGPFSIFRTQVFKELGGYKFAHHTEDLEMALRMQKHRYKIVNSHGAHVYTVSPSKFTALFKQRVRWTYGFLNNALDYRHMYFKKQYGNVGVFVLPIATLSIFTTLYAVFNTLWGGISKLGDALRKYQAVGFSGPDFNIDWYFFNTGIATILTTTALLLTLTILFLSIRLDNGKFKFTRGIIYYLALYMFLAPTWIAKALWKSAMRQEIAWGGKKE